MGVYIRNITKEQFIEDCNAMGVLVITEGISEIDLVRCGECKHSKEWYGDRCLCYLWAEEGLSVFKDGYCSYGERRAE